MSAAARAGADRALQHHADAGRIRGWSRHPDSPANWIADLNGGGFTVLRSTREAVVFCDALASAEKATLPAPAADESYAADAETLRKAIAAVGRYRGGWYTLLADLANLAAALDKAAEQ